MEFYRHDNFVGRVTIEEAHLPRELIERGTLELPTTLLLPALAGVTGLRLSHRRWQLLLHACFHMGPLIRGGAQRALLNEEADADADKASVLFKNALALSDRLKTYRRNCATQAFRMIAAVEVLSDDVLKRHRFGTDHVAKSDLIRFKFGFAGDCVHDGFDSQANAGPSDAAARQNWTFVGGDSGRAASVGGQDVGTRQKAGNLSRLQS